MAKKKLDSELHQKYIRALADYQNLAKRVEREKELFVKFANSVLILRMLPVLDNLERAQEHLKDEGIDLVIKQFKEALSSEGVNEVEGIGSEFNPEIHEAIAHGEGEEGKVIEVFEKGYKLGDKIIRPAKVRVGKDLKEEK